MGINITIVTQGVATVLLADFVTGAVHWAEEAYARRDTPLIGRFVAEANIEHHHRPRAFLARSWLASSWDLLLLGILLLAVAWWCDQLSWHIWLFAILAANANQIHKWTHQNAQENGPVVTWLQKMKLLQTQRHHARHHHGEKNSHYCVITKSAQSGARGTGCLDDNREISGEAAGFEAAAGPDGETESVCKLKRTRCD